MPTTWFNMMSAAGKNNTVTYSPITQVAGQVIYQGTWGGRSPVSFPSNVGAGNGIIACLAGGFGGSDTFSSVSGGGIPATGPGAFVGSYTDTDSAIWCGTNSAGGAKAITVIDANTQWQGVFAEFTGLYSTAPAVTVRGSFSSSTGTVTITPTRVGQLIIVSLFYSQYYGGGFTAGSGSWNELQDTSEASVYYLIATNTDPLTVSWTAAGGVGSILAAAFN